MRALLLLVLALVLTPALSHAAPPAGAGWERLDAGTLVFHHRPADAGIAAALAAFGPGALAEIGGRTGVVSPAPIDVVLTPTWGEFERAQPGTPPSWAAGTAYAERSEVYLRTRMPHTGADPVDKVFVHELVHVVLGQRFGGRDIPRWLNEGAAQLFAGELSTEDHATLVQAAIGRGLLPLSSITDSWPRNPAAARLAYAQSVDFVAFLADQREDALAVAIDHLASGQAIDVALSEATGRSLAALEEDWRGRMTFWHAWLPVLGGSGVTWGFGTLVFVVAGFRRRRAFHRKVGEMAAREAAARARLEAEADGAYWIATSPLPAGWSTTWVYQDGPEPSDEPEPLA